MEDLEKSSSKVGKEKGDNKDIRESKESRDKNSRSRE